MGGPRHRLVTQLELPVAMAPRRGRPWMHEEPEPGFMPESPPSPLPSQAAVGMPDSRSVLAKGETEAGQSLPSFSLTLASAPLLPTYTMGALRWGRVAALLCSAGLSPSF